MDLPNNRFTLFDGLIASASKLFNSVRRQVGEDNAVGFTQEIPGKKLRFRVRMIWIFWSQKKERSSIPRRKVFEEFLRILILSSLGILSTLCCCFYSDCCFEDEEEEIRYTCMDPEAELVEKFKAIGLF